MSNPYFQFKQFKINQERCAMKVGTDGVLLGARTDCSGVNSILDVGTGSGLIALMLAQRCEAAITAIEIDEDAAAQARENAAASPWKERITVETASLQDFAQTTRQRFDLIVSNPPFFNNSLKNPDRKRSLARHTDTLSYKSLQENSRTLLTEKGRLAVILPASSENYFLTQAMEFAFYCTRKTEVISRPGAAPKRCLLELGKEKKECVEDSLLIEIEQRVYSEKFRLLINDFYLDK